MSAGAPHAPIDLLSDFVAGSRRLFVLTGAGCSTESGIPDYRDADGNWKRQPPIRFAEFIRSDTVRRRYWARSFAGWPATRAAGPNAAHRALAALQDVGPLAALVTQNVDGLHQRAGSQDVIDLHGRLDTVRCMACGVDMSREAFQEVLGDANPAWSGALAELRPDGDADLAPADTAAFEVPPCPACGGVLKPDFVFFGESVPADRVDRAFRALGEADAVLVVGSSLMVWSGYRFAVAAAKAGTPVAIVNLGRTRADDLATLKLVGRCGELLPALVTALAR